MKNTVTSLCMLLAAQRSAQAFVPISFSSSATPTELTAHDRRAFVTGGVAAASSLFLPQVLPASAADVDYKAVAKDIMDMVEKDPDKGPSKLLWL